MFHSVRVGLRIDPRLGESTDPSARLAALLDLGVHAEERGFDVLWVAERHASDPAPDDGPSSSGSGAGLIPSSLVFCAGVAVRTQRLRIATGLLPLPLYHPLRVAEDGASIDGLSGGRFELGVGLGSDPGALTRFGVGSGERADRFDEALALLQMAWDGSPIEFHGRYFQVDGLAVHPLPVQRGGPPLWIGATAGSAQRKAADRGCGLVIQAGADPAPYLDRWSERDRPARPRIALWVENEAQAEAGAPACLVDREDAGRVALDWMLPVDAEGLGNRDPLDRWMPQIERLRALAAA